MTARTLFARPLRAMALLAALAACEEEERAAAPPAPVPLTTEAVSHFCQMNVLEHPGPKAQIHVAGLPAPLFFAQVRDAVAWLKSPEREGDVLAVYVSDMGAAPSWDAPGAENWTDAHAARFVVGAARPGDMGAPEIAPFAAAAAAAAFAAAHGGQVMTLEEIPLAAALAAVEFDLPEEEG